MRLTMLMKNLLMDSAVQLWASVGLQNILKVTKGLPPGTQNGWVLVLFGCSVAGACSIAPLRHTKCLRSLQHHQACRAWGTPRCHPKRSLNSCQIHTLPEACVLLWVYAVQKGSLLPTFRDNLSVSYRSNKQFSPVSLYQTTSLRNVTPQKSADIIYTRRKPKIT